MTPRGRANKPRQTVHMSHINHDRQYRGGSYTTYSDRQAWANSIDPDQTPQNAASDQGLHCLPLTQQFYKHSQVIKRTCWREVSKISHENEILSQRGFSRTPSKSTLIHKPQPNEKQYADKKLEPQREKSYLLACAPHADKSAFKSAQSDKSPCHEETLHLIRQREYWSSIFWRYVL